ncbi:hypothetical protein MKX01_035915 [Papaver californicum]|nr:hypothetical protein MKX01_035915 [Papaver californicum]
MTGQVKPNNHTAKEIQGGQAKFECPHRKITAPHLRTMQIHHESKHPKVPFGDTKIWNLHATSPWCTWQSQEVVDLSGEQQARCYVIVTTTHP